MRDIARLKITLDGVAPTVLRRVEVPLAIQLDDLHLVIQAAMGWENYHLYEFRVGRAISYGIPDPDWPDTTTPSAEKATLADLARRLNKSKAFKYVYDFGDNWSHKVSLEAVAPADRDLSYPRLLDAKGACPPEDCGGPFGYDRYLKAIADPGHMRHREMIDWRGPGFDPNAVDKEAIAMSLATLFSRRRRKTRS